MTFAVMPFPVLPANPDEGKKDLAEYRSEKSAQVQAKKKGK